jgi:hypothetical protein
MQIVAKRKAKSILPIVGIVLMVLLFVGSAILAVWLSLHGYTNEYWPPSAFDD